MRGRLFFARQPGWNSPKTYSKFLLMKNMTLKMKNGNFHPKQLSYAKKNSETGKNCLSQEQKRLK